MTFPRTLVFRVADPTFLRRRFVAWLQQMHIDRPISTVLDTLEQAFASGMIACSSAANAVALYEAAKAIPGSSTKYHLYKQHGVRVNGPLFPNFGPASVLIASNMSDGRPMILKVLSNAGSASSTQPGGNEAAAVTVR